jgi:hypothetical protein
VSVLIAIVVAILIAAAEALAEIIVIVRLIHVVAGVAEIRVLISVTVPVIGTPMVCAVGGPGPKALLVAVIHRLPQHVRSVLIDLVVRAAAAVAINRGGIEVRIVVVIVMFVAEAQLLLTLALEIVLLKTVLGHAPLLLQGGTSLLSNAFLLVQMLAILRHPLLLLVNQLLLALL